MAIRLDMNTSAVLVIFQVYVGNLGAAEAVAGVCD
jgi:hypothetical protein